MHCSICHTPHDALDNYCRHCGAAVAVEVPVVREGEVVAVAPWEQVKPVVRKGAMTLAAGIAVEYALRRLGKAMVRSAIAGATPGRRSVALRRDRDAGGIEVTETVYIRQVRRSG